MDKAGRRKAKQQFKAEADHQRRLRWAASDHPQMRAYAQIELGIGLPSITKETIQTTSSGFALEEQLRLKILEKAFRQGTNLKSVFAKEVDSIIEGFSEYLQVVYDTTSFESMIAIGDIDKVFHAESDVERKALDEQMAKLTRAYKLMDCSTMLTLIERASRTTDYETLREIAKLYERQVVESCRLTFIKDNWREFEMT